MLKSPAIRILCIDIVLSKKGGFTRGTDGKSTISDVEISFFVKGTFKKLLNTVNFDIRRVMIPKNDGTERPLGIPNLGAKIVQQLLLYVIYPVIENEQSDASFGFRNGRSAHQAVLELQKQCNHRKPNFIINADLEKCFDMISHLKINQLIKEKFPLSIQLGIIKVLCGKIVLPKGESISNKTGTPQGGIVSPTLCNMVLQFCFDFRGEYKNLISYVRYADDTNFLIYTNDINGVLTYLSMRLANAGLNFNKTKTVTHNVALEFFGFKIKFLGY
jgi:group II intron reverse transcriptase/maturase